MDLLEKIVTKKYKHIGIIGVSHEGAALCYREICNKAPNYMGEDFVHPQVSMHTLPLKIYLDYIKEDNWNAVAALISESAIKLSLSGADFAICPDNTVHYAWEKAKEFSRLPLLDIREAVAEECRSKKYEKVGVLGTKYTMEGGLYGGVLSRHGIETVIPVENDREIVHSIIFEELVKGDINDYSTKKMVGVIKRLKETECDAVVLGCTEIPLIINQNNSAIPPLDSTRLLAIKAIKYSLKK